MRFQNSMHTVLWTNKRHHTRKRGVTVSVTLNIYTHLDWSSKENAAKAMENAVKLPENTKIANPWED